MREERRSLARAGIVRGFDKDAYEHILEFPSIDTHEFVHGICVVGASSVNAYSSDQRLYYTQYDGFADGQVAWKDRDYTLEGIDGSVCAGGIYLQPSAHKVSGTTSMSTNVISFDIVHYLEQNTKLVPLLSYWCCDFSLHSLKRSSSNYP